MRKRLIVSLFSILMATPLFAVWPKPPYSQWPCSGASCGDADNCYSYRSFRIEDALQYKNADKSPRSTTEPTSPYGICSGYNGWCKLPPQLGSITYTVIPGDGTSGPRVRLNVPYDFPNNYCQVYDDGAPCRASVWPPKQTLFSPVTRLTVYSENGEPLAIAPAVFENGTWTPTLAIGCGQTMTFIVEAKNGGEFVPGCTTEPTVRQTITVTSPAGICLPDRRCTDCPTGGSANPPRGGGKPIHFGSGDVSVNVPLLAIDQWPLPLSIELAYHSSRPMFPNVVLPEPLGAGWTHTFNDVLLPLDPQALLLYRVDGLGYETLYERSGLNQWTPRTPGELRGRETVTFTGGQYRIMHLDGSVIAFTAGGRWLSTSDRWGNAITGAYDGANLASITDSAGRTIALSYLGSRLTSIALPTGQTWRFEGAPLAAIYDPIHTGNTPWRTISYLGRLLHEVADESGAVLEGHDYDALERGRTSYAAGNRDRITVTYGANSAHVVTAIDGAQTQTSDFTFSYQKGRYLTTSIVGSCASCGGADSESQSFTYDADNRVTGRTDGNGHVTRFTYDGNGNLVTRTEAAGTALERATSFAYERPAWLEFVTRVSEPSAAKPGARRVTTRTWNADESVLTITETGYLSPVQAETHTETQAFDARHRLVSTDGPRTDVADVNGIAYYADDDPTPARRGRPRQRTNAAGHTTQYDDYDLYGTPRRTTDLNGVVTRAVTDARGRVTQSTSEAVAGDPDESTPYTAAVTYDGRDRRVRETFPLGNGVAYVYEDGTNRLLATIRLDSAGLQHERQLTTRNDAGGITREEDQLCTAPAAQCTSWSTRRFESFTYDAHNRPKEKLRATPAGAKVVFTHDADGMPVSVQDENHTTPNVRLTYDALDRLVAKSQTLDGGVAVTRFDYDARDKIIAVTDPNGNVTRSLYDDFGRKTREESPDTGVTTYTWDVAGNPLSTTDARGATRVQTTDALRRMLTSTSTLGATSDVVTSAYDSGDYGKGHLTSITNATGTTSFQYDRRGLLRQETRTILGNGYTTEYGHDSNGNRNAIVYPSGRRVLSTFDFADRPLSLTGTLGATTRQYVTAAAYLPFGPETSRTSGTLTRNAGYDARYRLTAFDVRNGATPLADHRYAYDAKGNITTIADALDPRYSRSFAYDDLDRLTRADSGSALWGSATYGYDAVGNRLAHTLGTRTATYTYDTTRLRSVTESGLGTRTIDYDAAGNELPGTYSPRNQLVQGDGLQYLYDGRGLRVAQVGLSVGPLITAQPLSQPVCPGGSAVLAVTASGATGFQWQSSPDGTSWQDIGGATVRTLTVTPATATAYRVIVSNAAATSTSGVATITPTALATESSSGILYGDVTRDGAVNALDVAVLRGVLAGAQALTVPPAVADLDGDGVVDAVDLSLLGGFAGGAVSCLPRFPAFTPAAPAMMSSAARAVTTNQAAPNPAQYFFHSPELQLIAETEIRAGGGKPSIAIEYLWFNGVPVAEERVASNETRWTFTDHLGTPFLQTSAGGAPVWQAEYEPFGSVYSVRTGNAADQRLRFPGQESDDQTPDRTYNGYRWYRSAWGRYTQADPIASRGANPFLYARGEPLGHDDPLGLQAATNGFGRREEQMMQRALKRVKDFLDTNPCCLKDRPYNLLYDMQRNFAQTSYVYSPWVSNVKLPWEASPCAMVLFGAPIVFVGPESFRTYSDCPCLPAIIFHEVSHVSGTSDSAKHSMWRTSAYQLTEDCSKEGNLCKNWYIELDDAGLWP